MATALEALQKQVLDRLCLEFPEVDTDLIHWAAAKYEFNMDRIYKLFSPWRQTNNEQSEPHISESERNIVDENCDDIIELINKGYKVMILMRGLPGSGKTNLATQLLKRSLGDVNLIDFVFNTDDYPNKSDIYIYDPKELEEAHTWNQRRVFSSVKKGISPIIIDSPNLEIWEMQVYCIMAVQFGYTIKIVELATPWSLKLQELSLRNNGVDKKKIKSMVKRYQQGVTPMHLLAKFELVYTVAMPQYREHPPFAVPFEPPKLPNVANDVRKREPPVEYVHNFQNSRKGKVSVLTKADSDQPLDTDKNVENKNLDLINNSTDEFKSVLKTKNLVQQKDEVQLFSSTDNSSPLKEVTQTPEEAQKEAMDKLKAFLQREDNNNQLLLSTDDNSPIDNTGMEVDEPTNCGTDDASSETYLLDKTLKDNVTKGHNSFSQWKMKGSLQGDALKSEAELFNTRRIDGKDTTSVKGKSNARTSVHELTMQFEKTSIANDEERSLNSVRQLNNRKCESFFNITDRSSNNTLFAGVAGNKFDIPNVMPQIDDAAQITDDSSDEDNLSKEEDMVDFTLSEDQVEQLQKMFGRLDVGDNIKPVVQIPESMARQLHAAYVESLCRQIEAQSEYISRQVKEEEEFVKKLQESERQWLYESSVHAGVDEKLNEDLHKNDGGELKRMTPNALAQELNKQKLYAAFPEVEKIALDGLLKACKNDYRQTVKALTTAGLGRAEMVNDENLMEPPIPDTILNEMEMYTKTLSEATDVDEDLVDGKLKSARKYREAANNHMQKRRELQYLAQNYYQCGHYAVSIFYRQLAQMELKRAEMANIHATQNFIQENSENLKDTIDLHYLYGDAALSTLDVFIDVQISELRERNKAEKSCFVITGWGKRSKKGKPVIKPLVMSRLEQRKIQFTIINPGMLRIEINATLPMTTNIQK